MPPKDFKSLTVKAWIPGALKRIGELLSPAVKQSRLAQLILSDWITDFDKLSKEDGQRLLQSLVKGEDKP